MTGKMNWWPEDVEQKEIPAKNQPPGGLLAKFLRLAMAVNLVPVSRKDGGRLAYRPCSTQTVKAYLLWILLPFTISATVLIYMMCQAVLPSRNSSEPYHFGQFQSRNPNQNGFGSSSSTVGTGTKKLSML